MTISLLMRVFKKGQRPKRKGANYTLQEPSDTSDTGAEAMIQTFGGVHTESKWLTPKLGWNWLSQSSRKMCSPCREVRGAHDSPEAGAAGGATSKVKAEDFL